MSRREDSLSLRQMLDHAVEARQLIRRRSRASLDRDRLLALSVVRLLEVVGEAANRVSQETRKQLPDIPWSQIIGLRHRLIHAYDAVDLDVVWSVLKNDIPVLIDKLRQAMKSD